MLPFLLGSAAVLSPPQIGLPIALGSLGVRGIQGALQARKKREVHVNALGFDELSRSLDHSEKVRERGGAE